MDTSPLGVLCAQAMEQIADRYGADATVTTVALVVEVETEDSSDILTAGTDSRPWVQIAFLREGVYALEDRLDALREQEDADG